MNYQKLKTILNLKLITYSFALLFVLFFAISFFSPSNTISQSLPDCSTISGTADPGNNCLFFGMPLCNSVSSPDHRVNCADIIDLPLCDDIDNQSSALSGKNCVKECSDSAFDNSDTSLVRGTDYAVHNEDCIRFCDSVESGITANTGVNCVARKCNQLSASETPDPGSNCNLMDCNLLTPDELNDTKFDDSAKKYCEGDNIKCYDFVESQLPYVRVRSDNTMCQIHDCPASCVADDTSNIESQGTSYTNTYKSYITGGYLLSVACNPVQCQPTFQRQYRCSPTGDSNPTTADSNCDSSGTGATCINGYCYKTIDCNLTANASEAECAVSTDTGTIGSMSDSMDSWFYRPVPMEKATTGDYIRSNMSSRLCYTKSQLDDNHWGWHPTISTVFGNIDLGFYHSYLTPDQTRSPGLCDATNDGSRGTGYIYLCGNNGMLYNMIEDYTAYHKGEVQTEFTDTDATHKLKICLRFKNAMRPDDGISETCGARECGISCSFGVCRSQVCGFDVCEELTVTDSDPKECEMDDQLFDGNPSKSCMKTIDTYLRIRAVKYSNRICTFLDVKGHTAYPGNISFFNGSEKLSDGTCISGSSSSGDCGGKDTESDEGSADKWRTILRIPYIQNNLSGTNRGYYDKAGTFFEEQECIKTPLRVGPPSLYNIASATNSNRLFTPPLYLLNSRTIRNGNISSPIDGETYGYTDFHYPEVEVKFGLDTQKLSLGLGYIGDELSNPDPLGSATLTTTIGNIGAEEEVFIQKEYDANNQNPTLCLYRKVKNESGVYLTPVRVQCVKRKLPEIDNSAERAIITTTDPRKAVISAVSGNTYDNAKISLKYLAGFGSNSVDDNCSSDDDCTSAIELDNSSTSVPTCDQSIEEYQICAQRDECSQLSNECATNEINIQNAQANGESTASYLATREYCDNILLPICNSKKGISTTSSVLDFIGEESATTTSTNHYGWFNEICINSGFEEKLKNVVSYKISDGSKGKCLINPSSPYLTDNDSSTNCDDGGKAPNCLCIEAVDGVTLSSDQISRLQTPREAGLCVDIPFPGICPTINYNTNPNSDSSDPEYVTSSLSKTFYDDSTGVHTSHQIRSNGTASGHAEFHFAIAGMNDVSGECKGFWKNDTDPTSGATLFPQLSCLDFNGVAQWSTLVKNPCVRYSCQAITTSNPDTSGNYNSNYANNETGEDKGLSNGYAIWPSHTQTSDFPEIVDATRCITGFKKTGSSALFGSVGEITGYSGGTTPARYCDQLGNWLSPTNICERISCAAVNPPIPSSSSDSSAWSQWANSGGATFSSVNASRSSAQIQSESISYGTCNESIGFFQAPGSPAPSLECDYLGNWSSVQNPCVTQCEAISDDANASSSTNGYAHWNAVLNVAVGSEESIYSTQCVTGYVPYPYPPLKNAKGTSYSLTSGTPDYVNTIPEDVTQDVRSAAYPERTCQSATLSGTAASIWTSPSSSCVKTCPGSSTDPRIGVGITKHNGRNGTITVSWPETSIGETAYIYSPSNTNGQAHTAANYFFGRTNDYYALARYCNSNGKWSDPIPQCATNSGVISDPSATVADGQNPNATYTSPTGSEQLVAVGENAPSGVCKTNYSQKELGNNSLANIPSYTCRYKNSNENIDETYYQYVSGSSCVVYCPSISAGSTISNSHTYYSSSSNSGKKEPGDRLTLACNSGYGSTIVYNSRSSGIDTTTVTYDCGLKSTDYVFDNNTNVGCVTTPAIMNNNNWRNSYSGYENNDVVLTDRTATNPFITCQSDGTWSSVQNDCSSCRSCDNFSVPGDYVIYGFSQGNGHHFNLFEFNDDWTRYNTCYSTSDLSHNSSVQCEKRISISGNKRLTSRPTVKCVDGVLLVTNSYWWLTGGSNDQTSDDCL